MKFKCLSLCALLPLPIVAISTSCGKDSGQLAVITDIVKNNFFFDFLSNYAILQYEITEK